jgi:hypothetical protein
MNWLDKCTEKYLKSRLPAHCDEIINAKFLRIYDIGKLTYGLSHDTGGIIVVNGEDHFSRVIRYLRHIGTRIEWQISNIKDCNYAELIINGDSLILKEIRIEEIDELGGFLDKLRHIQLKEIKLGCDKNDSSIHILEFVRDATHALVYYKKIINQVTERFDYFPFED